MAYLITKEAYNVLNARLPDLVWSCEMNKEENKRFAAYFERNWAQVEIENWQDAFDLVQSFVGETPLLHDVDSGRLWMKDSTTPEIHRSCYSIIQTEREGKL